VRIHAQARAPRHSRVGCVHQRSATAEAGQAARQHRALLALAEPMAALKGCERQAWCEGQTAVMCFQFLRRKRARGRIVASGQRRGCHYRAQSPVLSECGPAVAQCSPLQLVWDAMGTSWEGRGTSVGLSASLDSAHYVNVLALPLPVCVPGLSGLRPGRFYPQNLGQEELPSSLPPHAILCVQAFTAQVPTPRPRPHSAIRLSACNEAPHLSTGESHGSRGH
jgi:hypothetical protein